MIQNALVFLLTCIVQLVFIQGIPDNEYNGIDQGYFNYYQCTLECYKDAFELIYIHGDLCKGTVKLDTDDWGDVPFEWVEESIQCITVRCRSTIPSTICANDYTVSKNKQYDKSVNQNKTSAFNGYDSSGNESETSINGISTSFIERLLQRYRPSNLTGIKKNSEVSTTPYANDENYFNSTTDITISAITDDDLAPESTVNDYSTIQTDETADDFVTTKGTTDDTNDEYSAKESTVNQNTNGFSNEGNITGQITDDYSTTGRTTHQTTEDYSNERSTTDQTDEFLIKGSTADQTANDYSTTESITNQITNDYSTTESTTNQITNDFSTDGNTIYQTIVDYSTAVGITYESTNDYSLTESTTYETADHSTENIKHETTIYSTIESPKNIDFIADESTVSTDGISQYGCSNFDRLGNCKNNYDLLDNDAQNLYSILDSVDEYNNDQGYKLNYVENHNSNSKTMLDNTDNNFDIFGRNFQENKLNTQPQVTQGNNFWYLNQSPNNQRLFNYQRAPNTMFYPNKAKMEFSGMNQALTNTQTASISQAAPRNTIDSGLPLIQELGNSQPISEDQVLYWLLKNIHLAVSNEALTENQESGNWQSAVTYQKLPSDQRLGGNPGTGQSTESQIFLKDPGTGSWQSDATGQNLPSNERLGNGNLNEGQIFLESQGSGNWQSDATGQNLPSNQILGNGNLNEGQIFLESQGSGNWQSDATGQNLPSNQRLGNGNLNEGQIFLESQGSGNWQLDATGQSLPSNQRLGNRNLKDGQSFFNNQRSRNWQAGQNLPSSQRLGIRNSNEGQIFLKNQRYRNLQSGASGQNLPTNRRLVNWNSNGQTFLESQRSGNWQSNAPGRSLSSNQRLGIGHSNEGQKFLEGQGLGNWQSAVRGQSLPSNQKLGNRYPKNSQASYWNRGPQTRRQ